MSLVHQALRKAEQEKLRKAGRPVVEASERVLPRPAAAATTAVAATTPVASGGGARSRGWALGLIVLFILLAGWVGVIALRSVRPPSETPTPATTVAAAAQPAASTSLPTEPAPVRSSDEERFKLTGITQLPDGGSAAVINGQLRSVDQYIDGAIIKRIEPDRVTLDVDGREVVKRLF